MELSHRTATVQYTPSIAAGMGAGGAERAGLLLASIHDVGPRFEAQVDALADRLAGHLGSYRFAMLVVPDHWGEAPLAQAPRYQAKLRHWAEQGVEMFLHGFTHRDDRPAGFRARHMTAGEGEFLPLGEAEARRRLREGRAIVEQAIGRPVAGFVAPAWLYGPGARAAIAGEGLPLAEDHLRIWRPADGAVLARGPVITWASRSRSRIASSLFFARLARTALRPLPVVRVAVHPGDVATPALLRSIDATFQAFGDRRPGCYAELGSTFRRHAGKSAPQEAR